VASFEIIGGDLRLALSGFEKLEGLHGDIVVPLGTVCDVRVVPTAWPELRGIRAPGTGFPGVVAVGTRRGAFGKDFAAVHGRGPAVVVELEGAPYRRLIATADNAESTTAMIRARTRR